MHRSTARAFFVSITRPLQSCPAHCARPLYHCIAHISVLRTSSVLANRSLHEENNLLQNNLLYLAHNYLTNVDVLVLMSSKFVLSGFARLVVFGAARAALCRCVTAASLGSHAGALDAQRCTHANQTHAPQRNARAGDSVNRPRARPRELKQGFMRRLLALKPRVSRSPSLARQCACAQAPVACASGGNRRIDCGAAWPYRQVRTAERELTTMIE